MQSKFVGDKLDFGKYGLLRCLCGPIDPDTLKPDLKLGITWYLTPDNCCRRDGGNTGYLVDTPENRRLYRACGPDLWDALKDLVDGNRRCVHEIPGTGILPNTDYFDAMLHFPRYLPRPARIETRRLWLCAALEATKDAAIVFLDPDTGIAPDDWKFKAKGPKYTYISDIQEFWGRGQSVVIYQHFGMGIPVERFVREKVALLRGEFGVEPIKMCFSRCVFLILPQKEHRRRIEEWVRRMLAENDGWGQHFGCPGMPNPGVRNV